MRRNEWKVVLCALALGTLAACDSPEEGARGRREGLIEQHLDHVEEATEEAAEGAAETSAAMRGESEFQQEIEGMRAQEAAEEAFEASEPAIRERLEREMTWPDQRTSNNSRWSHGEQER